jgi:hypothetical protein
LSSASVISDQVHACPFLDKGSHSLHDRALGRCRGQQLNHRITTHDD